MWVDFRTTISVFRCLRKLNWDVRTLPSFDGRWEMPVSSWETHYHQLLVCLISWPEQSDSDFHLCPFDSSCYHFIKFQHANHTPTLPQRAEMIKCSCLYDNVASQVAIPPGYPLTWKSWFTVMLSAFLHRQKSQSCSSSWPPKTLRLNACRPSCWPEAAQPMTAQREVHTAGSLTKHHTSTHVDVCVSVNSDYYNI